MLVLTRLEGQSILLDGGRIRIMVVAVRASNGQVRLGFDVPDQVDVVREEIAEDFLKYRRGPGPHAASTPGGPGPAPRRSRRSPG